MPKEDKNILKYNHGEKSMKVPLLLMLTWILYLKKIDTCHSIPEKSSTTKIKKDTCSGYSLFTHC